MARTDLADHDAMLFDLDGVLTRTASVHNAAWTRLFDEFLSDWSARSGVPFRPFDPDEDYRLHVDGRRRSDGITAFLRSRGIELPAGDPDDGEDAATVTGLGRRKDRWFNEALEQHGVQAYRDGVQLVERLRQLGKPVAVVSASENAVPVLRRAGLLHLFPVQVTGLDAKELGLAGKPAPDTFLEGARRLGVEPGRAVVFEDAIAGVEAGRAGGFGLVVGVDRVGAADALRASGADVVVSDLGDLLP